ncbi:RIP metalloprotease RseP [soil metagenome]
MLTIIAFLVVIGVLVFVHEFGHLIAAKSVDIEVPRFSIGFGPRIWGFHRGETEYVISALPLGGYVRMAGMEDTAALEGGADLERAASSRDFDAKPLWARIWVVSAGVLMNFIFAILVLAGIAFFYGDRLVNTTRIEVAPAATESAMAAELAELPRGAELMRVGGTEVSTWNDVVAALTAAPAGPLTLEFTDAKPVSLTVPSSDTARMSMLRLIEPFVPAVIGEVSPGSAAAQAGLRTGDHVVAAAGEPIETWTEFVSVVQAHPGQELPLEIIRNGARVSLIAVPTEERELGPEMERLRIGRLGVGQQSVEIAHRPLGLGPSLQRGWTETWGTAGMIVGLLGDLFTGEASPRSLGGPLAIGQISGQAASLGLEMFLRWMALLSVNLAVLNLLPIPVLDGGQLLFLGVEGIRGRALSVEQRMRLSNVGLIIVVGIMVWAIANDFLRFFGI